MHKKRSPLSEGGGKLKTFRSRLSLNNPPPPDESSLYTPFPTAGAFSLLVLSVFGQNAYRCIFGEILVGRWHIWTIMKELIQVISLKISLLKEFYTLFLSFYLSVFTSVHLPSHALSLFVINFALMASLFICYYIYIHIYIYVHLSQFYPPYDHYGYYHRRGNKKIIFLYIDILFGSHCTL